MSDGWWTWAGVAVAVALAGLGLWLLLSSRSSRFDGGARPARDTFRRDEEPLVHFQLLRITALRSGLGMFLAQNAILMGIFFTVPLYLQVVQGYDAFKTGVEMLPVSIAMLVTATLASRFGGRWSARSE